MIKLAFDNNFKQLNNLFTREIIDRILEVYYPQLMMRLKQIGECMEEGQNVNRSAGKAILLRINQELSGLMGKERALLFPLLIVLEGENRKSGCEPFKLVKKHYQSILSSLQVLGDMLQADDAPLNGMQQIKEQLIDFEQELTQLQRAKEKYLFNKFKTCDSGCKIQPYEQGE